MQKKYHTNNIMNNYIYKNIISDISKSLKYQLNEMARKSVNRTIDKKLWLTVSSIISRNRSTEAENVNPIGSDKNNLLLRYVASLLIMKKPCPTTIEDIGKLKTFKKIGYKFIDLGGTILEIQSLYNQNTDNNSSSNNTNTDNKATKEKVNISSDNTEDDNYTSDFWDKFDSEDDNDSFFSDIDNAEDDTIYNQIDRATAVVNKSTPIDLIFKHIVNISLIPSAFKLNKKGDTLELIAIKKSNGNRFNRTILSTLLNANWNRIVNPVFEKIYNTNYYKPDSKMPTTTKTFPYFREHNSYDPHEFEYNIFPVQLTPDVHTLNDIKNQLASYEPYFNNNKKLKNWFNECINENTEIYQDIIDTYNKLDSLVENKIAANIFKLNSNIYCVYISPDNGLIYISEIVDMRITEVAPPGGSIHYIYSDKSLYIKYSNVLKFEYNMKYTIKFTGENNYYDTMSNNLNDEKLLLNKNLENDYKKFNKLRKLYAPWLHVFINKNAYKNFLLNFMYYNGTYSIKGKAASSDFTNNYHIDDFWWKKKNKNNVLCSTNSHGKRTYYKIAPSNLYDTKIFNAAIIDTNENFIVKQYKMQNDNLIADIELSLLPNGLAKFNAMS